MERNNLEKTDRVQLTGDVARQRALGLHLGRPLPSMSWYPGRLATCPTYGPRCPRSQPSHLRLHLCVAINQRPNVAASSRSFSPRTSLKIPFFLLPSDKPCFLTFWHQFLHHFLALLFGATSSFPESEPLCVRVWKEAECIRERMGRERKSEREREGEREIERLLWPNVTGVLELAPSVMWSSSSSALFPFALSFRVLFFISASIKSQSVCLEFFFRP